MHSAYDYEYAHDDAYCYPGTNVLINKLNLRDADELKRAEREITSLRTAQAMQNRIDGNFDFAHLRRIHHFLFGDIYSWAGNVRTVNISKGSQFCICTFIEEQMTETLSQLANENYLRDYNDKLTVAKRLAFYLSEINAIHPFREGNGRTQRLFIEHLAYQNGYCLDYAKITSKEMLEASLRSFNREYDLMEQIIEKALE